jgi:hypothetical protein
MLLYYHVKPGKMIASVRCAGSCAGPRMKQGQASLSLLAPLPGVVDVKAPDPRTVLTVARRGAKWHPREHQTEEKHRPN